MSVLIGKTLSRYRILEQIGAGGMGEVYRARDTRLARDVAVKILPAELSTSPIPLRRFQDEARAAGALNHPNVLTVFDFDEHEGIHFEVTELLEGATLRELAGGRALPVRQVVEYGVQIARGLSAAHEKGIVHRDLKPENLFVTTDGRVKILDFGVAKVTQAASTGTGTGGGAEPTRTEPGMIVGTGGYMAPEQARGEPLDHRADIFALGAVLYELLTGRRAFPGKTPVEAMGAVLHLETPPLASIRRDVPPQLDRVVRRCLEKSPRERIQSALDLAHELQSLAAAPSRPAGLPSWLWLAGGALGVVALAAALLVLNPGNWRSRLLPRHLGSPIRSLAVLPFVNLSRDPDQEYFVDGMTDELTARLAQIGALRVVARTSSMRYKTAPKAVPDIGRELRVDAVVEGSVLRSGDQVRVTVQLVRAATDSHLWAESYERSLRDVLSLQSELARSIAGEIAATVTPGERDRLGRGGAVNPRAHEAYLRGRYLWNQRTFASIERSIAFFQQAIDEDPEFAQGYMGLASAYAVLPHYRDIPGTEIGPKVRAAAKKALELDPTLGEARATLAGNKQEYEWDFAGADREFRRAIELAPNSATVHQWYGEFLGKMKRFPESLAELKRAAELDPLSPIVPAMIVDSYGDARQYDRAIEYSQEARSLFPDFRKLDRETAKIYQAQGQYDKAIAGLERDGLPAERATELRAAVRAEGPRGYWRKILENHLAARERGYVSPYQIAGACAQLGRRDEAFRWLDRAYEDRDVYLSQILVTWTLDPLRGDPRFQKLLKRVGFAG